MLDGMIDRFAQALGGTPTCVARGELDHSRVEAFLKTGAAGTAEEQKKMCEQMHLTDYNYRLLIPAQERQAETHVGEELRLMMISEQVRQSYGRTQFVYNTTAVSYTHLVYKARERIHRGMLIRDY